MTKQEKVAAWLETLNFRWSQGGYWMHDTYGALAPDQATFFYDVVMAAIAEGANATSQVFLTVLEQNGLLSALGEGVLEELQKRTHLKQEGKTNG